MSQSTDQVPFLNTRMVDTGRAYPYPAYDGEISIYVGVKALAERLLNHSQA